MKTILAVAVACVLALSGCSSGSGPEAVIRVRLKDGGALPDKFTLMAQQEVLRSSRYLQHVSNELSLAKTWGVNEDGTIRKLREALVVRTDETTGQVVLQMHGFERDLAVKTLNALCDFYATDKHVSQSNGGPRTELQGEVIRRAQ
jgi:hypothetical protein